VNSGSFTHNNGLVTFNGSGIQNLTANTPTEFYQLTINSGVTLVETVAVNNVTINNSGALLNQGTIQKSLNISGIGPLTFGLTEVTVDVTAQGSLNNLQINRIDANDPHALSTNMQTGKYWTLTPTGTGYLVNLTIPQNNLSAPKACKYPGNLGGDGWDCAVTTFNTTSVTRNNISALDGDWTVGNNVGPTSIQLQSLYAYNSSGSSAVLILVFGGLVLMAGTIIWRKVH
jgi:hypothetical protein